MNPDHQPETWQVEVGGQIFEAPLSELPEWIVEGSLQPGDKVRKGNLRWIEARKVPALIPFFNAKAKGEPMPFVQSVTDAAGPAEPSVSVEPDAQTFSPNFREAAISPAHVPQQEIRHPARNTTYPQGQCAKHDDRAAAYVCSACGVELCKACPSSYGGSVRICPDCGSMCRTAGEVAKQAKQSAVDLGVGTEPFGFSDFGRAISYPFKFKSSLFFGGLMFMIFTFGQSAASLGGFFLAASAIFCFMLANMVVFGIRANVIDNFSQGNLDVDFMPSFEDFSIWDDVVHPFFLYIGAMLSSFGPFLLVFVIGFYLILSTAAEEMQKYNHELTRVPGTQVYAPDRTAEQTKEVNELLSKVRQQADRRVGQQQQVTETAETGVDHPAQSAPNGEPDQEDLEKLLEEIREKQARSAAPISPEDSEAGYLATLSRVLRLAAPLVIFGFLTVLWGLFYYPAACAVAGYTRSFSATINPMVGLDTIRRLGGSYVLILIMGFLVGVMSIIVMGVVAVLFSPFKLPMVGNLPATVISSFVSLYFSVVFSCILGYALFKSRDKLKLYR